MSKCKARSRPMSTQTCAHGSGMTNRSTPWHGAEDRGPFGVCSTISNPKNMLSYATGDAMAARAAVRAQDTDVTEPCQQAGACSWSMLLCGACSDVDRHMPYGRSEVNSHKVRGIQIQHTAPWICIPIQLLPPSKAQQRAPQSSEPRRDPGSRLRLRSTS